MKPKAIEQALNRALALHQAGDHDEAAAAYAKVRSADVRNYSAWFLAGALAFQRGGHLAEAVTLLLRARKLRPDALDCRLFLGMALADDGRHADARPHLEAALKRFPEKTEAWDNLAEVYLALEQPEKAVEALQKLHALLPTDAEVCHRLALVVSDTQGYAAALPHFEKAAQLDPVYSDSPTSAELVLPLTPQRPA